MLGDRSSSGVTVGYCIASNPTSNLVYLIVASGFIFSNQVGLDFLVSGNTIDKRHHLFLSRRRLILGESFILLMALANPVAIQAIQ